MDPTEQEQISEGIASIETIDLSSLSGLATDTISLGTINLNPGGGYTLGSGTASNAIWTTTTTGTGTGAIGQQLYTIGPNTVSWGDLSVAGSPLTQSSSGKLTLRGEQADIDINGKSMLQWMQKVEERLNILTPNPELEKDWGDLRKLGERYRKLEKKCKEKAEVWKKLKSMPPPNLD